jgi:hypothetical protein
MDRKLSLEVEISDDTKDNSHEAVGWRHIPIANQLFGFMLPYLKLSGFKPTFKMRRELKKRLVADVFKN